MTDCPYCKAEKILTAALTSDIAQRVSLLWEAALVLPDDRVILPMIYRAIGDPHSADIEGIMVKVALAKNPPPPCQVCPKQALQPKIPAKALLSGKPRLILLTTLGAFHSSYSLTTVIHDQAVAGIKAGYQVDLVGMKSMSAKNRLDIKDLTYVPLIPNVGWKEDEVDAEKTSQILEAIIPYLRESAPATVITHDLLLQSWYLTAAASLHAIGDSIPGIRWFHQVHSSVGPRPAQLHRCTLPKGHRLAAVNYSDVGRLANYYQTQAEDIVTIPNIRSAPEFFGLSHTAARIADITELELADVVQIFPLSTPRAFAKGIDKAMEFLGRLREDFGLVVKLVVANSDAPGNQSTMDTLRALGQDTLKGGFYLTSDLIPTTGGLGLPMDDIRGLMQFQNVFCFPSTSEACGLTMLEAALSKSILVLNDDLPVLKDFIHPEQAIWVPWGSIHTPRTHAAIEPALLKVYQALQQPAMLAQREILQRGLKHLAGVLGGLAS